MFPADLMVTGACCYHSCRLPSNTSYKNTFNISSLFILDFTTALHRINAEEQAARESKSAHNVYK